VPKLRSELRSVLGFANYFQSFIQNFSVRIAEMEKMLSPNIPFVWSECHEAEFKM
jgi:hypothetical protein